MLIIIIIHLFYVRTIYMDLIPLIPLMYTLAAFYSHPHTVSLFLWSILNHSWLLHYPLFWHHSDLYMFNPLMHACKNALKPHLAILLGCILYVLMIHVMAMHMLDKWHLTFCCTILLWFKCWQHFPHNVHYNSVVLPDSSYYFPDGSHRIVDILLDSSSYYRHMHFQTFGLPML